MTQPPPKQNQVAAKVPNKPKPKNETQVKDIKLRPEGDVHSTSGNFDCCAFIIHCAVHDKILVTKQEGALWMPYTQMAPNRSWKHGALFGFCVVLAGPGAADFDTLKESPPYQTFKTMQVLRVQMPQTAKFCKRMIYYFKIKAKADNFKCCQPIGSHLVWLPLTEVKDSKVDQLWGPELIEFSQLIADKLRPKIAEYSLEEAYQFLPRDPPRNQEESLLKSVRMTLTDVERLYADFLDHCFPSLYMTQNSFSHYMSKYEFEKDLARLDKLFKTFNYADTGFLSFHELLLGLACMEPNSLHSEYRVKFIFRYYDTDKSGGLSEDELKQLVSDIVPADQVETKLKESITTFGSSSIDGRNEVSAKDFIISIGSHKFRGTSNLCRSSKSIFAQIARKLAGKNLHHQTGCKSTLTNVLIKSKPKEICPTCSDKKYEVASNQVVFDFFGKQQSNRLNKISTKVAEVKGITAQQYSLECVFNPSSAANVTIKLLREFSQAKGTVEEPKGLMMDRKEDFWKLLNVLYNEIDVLLAEEDKCQKVYSPCYIIGDIHGNLEDLLSLEKTLWKQMPSVGANFLFLGDYVDRGKWGLECALYLVAFKILCPNKVTLLRGNHEVRSLQKHYSYYHECILKYGEVIGLKVWELTNKMFDKFPVCGLVDEAIFCAHGGIPRSTQQTDQIASKVPRELRDPEKQSAIAWEILWSDPCPLAQFMDICENKGLDPDAQNGYIFNVKRGTAFLFNESGATSFLRNNYLTHIIRAHEVAQPGYVFHFGSKCVTIFSSSHYCGNDNDCGFIFADNQRLRVITMDTVNNGSATD